MAIPQNFFCVEQQIIAVDDVGTDTGATFSVAPPAGVSTVDCFVENIGSNPCQVLFASTLALAEAVAQDAGAAGTSQVKVGAGLAITLRKGVNQFVGARCESGLTTTLYLHAGQGGVT